MTLTINDIIDGARAKTGGLPDPDHDTWREGLEILVKDHAEADRLTAAELRRRGSA